MFEQQLEKYFGFSTFRPGQKEVIENILAGNDVVALMPTGGGKSLCYQLPALMLPGVTVVISPLIALMKDQVDSLTARGIAATFINSSLDQAQMNERMDAVRSGNIKLLYIAPERLAGTRFQTFFSRINVSLIAVDEAHCVSEWGHDFRPDYLLIRTYIQTLQQRPIVAAFTATATPEVRQDIVDRLELQHPRIFVRGFDRPNLKFFAQSDLKPKERLLEVARLVKSLQGSGIVYALTRKETERIAEFLKTNTISASAYHAGLSSDKREQIQNDFMENRFKVIVATIAFGMGVDKADIRFVIHCGMPKNLEGYYQEAGRAGRDGEVSYCILLHSKKDANTHQYFIRGDQDTMYRQGNTPQEITRITRIKYDRLDRMIQFATATTCRRRIILGYFDDPAIRTLATNCKGCDTCLGWQPKPARTYLGRRQASSGVKPLISNTVLETVKLYQQKKSIGNIAKIRSLGITTILNHLADWYAQGGELNYDAHITPAEEQQILAVIRQAKDSLRLKSIKEQLPEQISYWKIKLVLAKLQRNQK